MEEKIILLKSEPNEDKTVDFVLSDKKPKLLFVPNGINRATIFNNRDKPFTIIGELVFLGAIQDLNSILQIKL